jgi:hypothetical protein
MLAAYASTRAHMRIYLKSVPRPCVYTSYVHVHMQRISRPLLPHVTSGKAVKAPEDVEHPVGRPREAHDLAWGGAGAGGEGAGGLEAEEQQEGDEQPAADCVRLCQEAIQTESTYGKYICT